MRHSLNFKKKTIAFHIISGVAALITACIFFWQQQKFCWMYAAPLFFFIASGAMIYAFFYTTLRFFEKACFGFLFVAPLLTIIFFSLCRLFELYFFGS